MASDQDPAIHSAVDEGDLGALRALLAQDASNCELRDSRGWTPLMRAVAADNRRLEVVELLISQGARADRADTEGREALHVLCQGTGEECDGPWPARYVKCLLDANADLEAVTAWGWTPLAATVMEGDEELAYVLLSAGANPNVRFSQRAFPLFTRGSTLAHFCTAQVDGVRFLGLMLDSKLDLTWLNPEGETVQDLCERTLREPDQDMDEDALANLRECARLLKDR